MQLQSTGPIMILQRDFEDLLLPYMPPEGVYNNGIVSYLFFLYSILNSTPSFDILQSTLCPYSKLHFQLYALISILHIVLYTSHSTLTIKLYIADQTLHPHSTLCNKLYILYISTTPHSTLYPHIHTQTRNCQPPIRGALINVTWQRNNFEGIIFKSAPRWAGWLR